ncbi:MAG: hypothetical protein OEV44_01160 [Spirochaetota bacterium]|nr:hypothetical protein [Spirochaetota bacterium]
METQKTFSIYRSYDEQYEEKELNEIADILSEEVGKKIEIKEDLTGDEGYTLRIMTAE